MSFWTDRHAEAAGLLAAFFETNSAAAEVILRRTHMMMHGRMSASEALDMVTEKAAAFAEASRLAAMAVVGGGDAVAVARAAIGPYGQRTRANVERLRQ